jgi:hypothetical protein
MKFRDKSLKAAGAPEEDYPEAENSFWEKRKGVKFYFRGFGFSESQLVWGGAVLLVIVIIGLVFLLRSGPAEQTTLEIDPLQENLRRLEERIARSEALGDALSGLPKLQKDLDLILIRLERLEANAAKVLVNPPEPKAGKEPEEAVRAAKPKSFHQVKPGETLYAISRRYGMTVNELRQLNKLPAGATLQVGQRLLVK